VTGVRFPVRVTEVGRQTLTVQGLGGQRSDAVARSVLARGLAFVKATAGQEKLDAYSLAIIANAFLAAAPADPFGGQMLNQLEAMKKEDGSRLDKNGNYGSTQATIWTLRALLLAASKGTEGVVGSFTVEVDGAPFTSLALTADQSDVMTTVDLGAAATVGSDQIKLGFQGNGKVSYNLVARHHVPWANMPEQPAGPLSLSVSYDKTRLAMDDTATATVVVRNTTTRAQDMILVTVGLPPGFQVDTDDLDRSKNEQVLSDYELTGKQVLLYLPGLPARQSRSIRYRLKAVMPVRAADGGGEAFLYYQPEQRAVARANTLEVQSP
jgi:hypothetical protein